MKVDYGNFSKGESLSYTFMSRKLTKFGILRTLKNPKSPLSNRFETLRMLAFAFSDALKNQQILDDPRITSNRRVIQSSLLTHYEK